MADEEAIDKVTAVSGSGPAYFFGFLEVVINAGEALCLDRALVDEMAKATMAGAAAMLRDPATHLRALKQAVRSPKGTTDAALSVLEADDSLNMLVMLAIKAAHGRALDLKSSVS